MIPENQHIRDLDLAQGSLVVFLSVLTLKGICGHIYLRSVGSERNGVRGSDVL